MTPESSSAASPRAIRRGRADEVDLLLELINTAYLVESHFVSGPRITREAVQSIVQSREFLVLDAPGAQTVAAARLSCHEDRATLGLLSVKPERQGQGLGRHLVTVAEMVAASQGCSRMELQVVNRRDELLGFYASLGYEQTGTSLFDESKQTLLPVHFIDMRKAL